MTQEVVSASYKGTIPDLKNDLLDLVQQVRVVVEKT